MLSLVTPNLSICDENRAKTKKILEQELKSEIVESQEIENINIKTEQAFEEANKRILDINDIDDTMKWFISYKNIINDYLYILDPPEDIYDQYTNEELELLFRVVQAEVGDEYSFEQKVNVASVIFNRIAHEDFPDKMKNVLSEDQFQVISDGRYKEVEVSETTILACEYSFMFGDTTDGCLFFDSNGKLKYEFVYSDRAHNFYR